MIIKFPNRIIQKLKNSAPRYDVSENSGRRGGYYGDANESAAGYKSICIYVQNGLAEYAELFKEIAKGIFKIQSNNMRKYPLVVFGFGNTAKLQHEKKHFAFGYLNDSFNDSKVSQTIVRISGSTQCNPAIIPELFPKTDSRSLYTGKIKIEREDLLIIIGKENEIFFSETIKEKITDRLKKQILLVVIGKEDVLFTKEITLEYKSIQQLNANTMVATESTFRRNLSTQP